MSNQNPVSASSDIATATPAISGLDYQAFWTTSAGEGWMELALAQAGEWVRDRLGLDVDLTRNNEASNPSRTKRVQVLHRQAGREEGVRLRAWNTNHGTTFTVTILAVNGPSGGWLLVQATSSDRSRRTAKPAVADRILSVVDFSDVGPLRSTTRHVGASGLDDLEDLIDDPDRRLPVIVAAPVEGIEFDRWIAAVDRWTTYIAGIAHVVSLDPNSAAEFARRHGRRAVLPATLRTYPPGSDLADPAVEQASKWLTPRSLAEDDVRVSRSIETFIRQYQVSHPVALPPAVREWSRAFDRFAAQQLRDAVSPVSAELDVRVAERQAAHRAPTRATPPAMPPAAKRIREHERGHRPVEEMARLRAQLEESERARQLLEEQLVGIQDFLSLTDLSEGSLLELLDAATRTHPDSGAIQQLLGDNERLQSRVEELEDALLLEQINYSESVAEQDRLEYYYEQRDREAAYLRSRLAESDTAAAFGWIDDGGPSNPLGEPPADWDAFVADPRLADNGIVLTGNKRRTRDLAGLDIDGSALQAAWDAMGTLVSYRSARLDGTWESGVHSFCEAGPRGAFHVPPNRHAQDESSITRKNKRLADYRRLPVPASVDSTELVHMWTHFKPFSWSADQKLRIHYYDQVTSDGHIYVGHVGMHLPSGSTDKIHR
ncbi:hypothetical protein LLS1_02310 [Leifsonia sp. LS1]|uniref:hypothetical protein n=1 Tax=Leifsonia sp. LS1 TaxID=2828483 RepID=UPI001CFF2545|nr:hypothetical protein [Leifsonia sp. LS1]GIT78562.1 hypothetical protein LLS1_02310 [Leifsonia sp. LS1]